MAKCDNLLTARVNKQACGVTNGYDDWQKLGVDRWLAMLAAYHAKPLACCVVDCGTAVTVDMLNDKGQHLGGYIVPGIDKLQHSLPAQISADLTKQQPVLIPGITTNQAVVNGIYTMLTNFINYHFNNFKINYPQAKLYLTGGNAQLLAASIHKPYCVCQDLVLRGLRLVLSK